LQDEIGAVESGIVVIVGTGASLIASAPDLLIYADMPRWEIQLRFRSNKVSNLGAQNFQDEFSYQYKRAFFVDWRVCDRHKKDMFHACDYFLDTTVPADPKMVNGAAIKDALVQTIKRPFRIVPFFDPGPWGGQWLKEVIDLDRSAQNFAWGFDCVPEENSLVFRFNNCAFEIPSINLVFMHPKELLGDKVYEAFGAEFPIRFDFLDTMEGGNLSLQVHPLLEYIREKFGMGYTQDESYYFLEAKDEAFVYLGLKEKVNPEKMVEQLQLAQEGGEDFDAEQFVEKWPIKKHDHVLIPAGTVHCSGANSVVLEISATPYIFTFKLWDWGRMGLDGKPRPISLEHGKNVIKWDRTREWTKDNILNQVEQIAEGEGWREERTGLDKSSFIETRRHWFTGTVAHDTNGVVNVLNLIEGTEAIVESPSKAFEPFVIHYAETFIVPAVVGAYTVRPYGESIGKQCATIKASVRTQNLINYQLN
jgi:mannose-6-phosphate isomerase class I